MENYRFFQDLINIPREESNGRKRDCSRHPLIRTCGLRTSWQKFATLIPKNTRTCLAKQDQAGSYIYVGYS